MKKTILFITTLFFVFSLCIVANGEAVGTYTVMGSGELDGSSRFKIQICIENCIDICGGEGTLKYDAEYLRLISFVPASDVIADIQYSDYSTNGVCRFYFYTKENFQGSSHVAELEFQLLAECDSVQITLFEGLLSDGKSDIYCEDCIFDDIIVPAQTEESETETKESTTDAVTQPAHTEGQHGTEGIVSSENTDGGQTDGDTQSNPNKPVSSQTDEDRTHAHTDSGAVSNGMSAPLIAVLCAVGAVGVFSIVMFIFVKKLH